MIQKIKPISEEEWKEHRKNGIGSSDVGTILGENKYEGFHMWWEYRTGRREEKVQTDAMARGHFAEDFVAKFFAYKTGAEIIKSSASDIIYYDDEHPWRRATPDRFCWVDGAPRDPNNMKCKFILECKTYSGRIENGEYLKYWWTQVMYQLGICGCDYGYLAWVDSSFLVDFVRIDFDKDAFDAICMAVDSAWEYNIKRDIEPNLDNYDDVVGKFNRSVEGKTVTFNNELSNRVLELKEINEQIKILEKRREEIKTDIALAMEDAECAVDEAGVVLCTFKHSCRFDPKEVERQDLSLYNEYLVDQPKVFDAAAFKKEKGNKVYKQFCTAAGPRMLKTK